MLTDMAVVKILQLVDYPDKQCEIFELQLPYAPTVGVPMCGLEAMVSMLLASPSQLGYHFKDISIGSYELNLVEVLATGTVF